MTRGKNIVEPVTIELPLNAQTVWYLDRMIETGLFGNTRPEAARIALYDHCKLLVTQGKLQMAPPIPGNDALPIAQDYLRE
jgi:hypothetical protein